jgi:hypothetical protein
MVPRLARTRLAAPALLFVGGAALVAFAFLRPTVSLKPPLQDFDHTLDHFEGAPQHSAALDAWEDKLHWRLRRAASPDDRVKLLEGLLEEPEARYDLPDLRESMLMDAAPTVRRRAFEISLALADRAGAGAVSSLLQESLDTPHAEVRRAALRACAMRPRPEFTNALVEIAENDPGTRFLAVTALAHVDHPDARANVLRMARSEEIPKAERLRAIALLARAQSQEGMDYLRALGSEEDDELREVAIRALAAIQNSAQ